MQIIYDSESLNHSLRKSLKTKSVFPNDQSALKLIYLALRNISKRWTMPIRDWSQALNQFAILYPDRLDNKILFTQN